MALEGASINSQSLSVVTPCDTFSGALSIAEGFEATFDNGEAEATFDSYATTIVTYYVASAYHATLVLTYNYLVLHRKWNFRLITVPNTIAELSAIVGLATAPGGSNIVFDSAVPSYELVTAYGFVNVSVSPTSRISIGTINGVATNEAEINLALGAVSTVVVGLQSVEYGCPIGAVYTISAEQGENSVE